MGFTFSKEQRHTLSEHMKRLPADLVQSFLNRCEQAISEWQAEWPLERMTGNKGASDRLRALSDALLQVRCEIMKLPEGASYALWIRLHEAQTERNTVRPWAVRDAFVSRLLVLKQEAGTLADDLSNAGGVVKYCERDLVDRLVQAYFDSSFSKQPSDATNGTFMRMVGEIENMLSLPGGKKLTMGRDIVGDSIKWHKRREEEFAQWRAGMYEFPTKQES